MWEWHLRMSTTKIEVSSIDNDHIELKNPKIVGLRVGKSLAIDKETYNLQSYAKEIGTRTCSKGYNMPHWSRMFALLHPDDGESIIGRASFDDPELIHTETSVECLIVSSNPSIQNPHTFEETESINVLLIRKHPENDSHPRKYTRLGVGEIFVRTGERITRLPDRRTLDQLTLM